MNMGFRKSEVFLVESPYSQQPKKALEFFLARCNKPIKDSTLQFSWFKKGEIIMEAYKNKVVIITGASESIGRALSFEFAK